VSIFGSSQSFRNRSRPLASREALTYRAARWIATCANPGGSLAEPTMLWPFNHFRKPRNPSRGTIEAIYGMIVTQAREPLFYRDLGVPDTVNGRFDMLVLHLWMVLRRLKSIEGGVGLSQTLFDHFCDDMDANLREMGVGDLTVPKRMQAFGEAFYGRAAAYDLALAAGAEPLAQALCKNILNGKEIENARRLAFYAETAIAHLAELDDATLQSGSWRFPSPARVGVQQ
jgi:cytochrome b pre-mRNA-processing protein 3